MFSRTRLSLSSALLSRNILLTFTSHVSVHNPRDPKTSGLASFPFARHYLGNRFYFLFLRLLRCFSSPGSLYIAMYSLCSDGLLQPPGFPIRTSAGQSLFAAYRSFSQLTTSFIGSCRQGIPPMLLVA